MAVHGCPRSNLESTLRCPHGRILALPPADREPSRFAAHGQAQKHLVFAVRPSGPTCCGRGPSAVRGQYRDAPQRPHALLALFLAAAAAHAVSGAEPDLAINSSPPILTVANAPAAPKAEAEKPAPAKATGEE